MRNKSVNIVKTVPVIFCRNNVIIFSGSNSTLDYLSCNLNAL